MKKWIIPLMLGFGVTMALLIGERMSTDAMAVVVGVAVGVTASVPTSLLLVSLLRRERKTWQTEQPQSPPPAYPMFQQQPTITVSLAELLGARNNQQQYMPLPPPDFAQDGGMRRLRVVGDDDDAGQGDW